MFSVGLIFLNVTLSVINVSIISTMSVMYGEILKLSL